MCPEPKGHQLQKPATAAKTTDPRYIRPLYLASRALPNSRLKAHPLPDLTKKNAKRFSRARTPG